jgi:hypothetical protein
VKRKWLPVSFAAVACLLLASAFIGETFGLFAARSAEATNRITLSAEFPGGTRGGRSAPADANAGAENTEATRQEPAAGQPGPEPAEHSGGDGGDEADGGGPVETPDAQPGGNAGHPEDGGSESAKSTDDEPDGSNETIG